MQNSDTVPEDFAEKILHADRINIIKKVKEGGILTEAQRSALLQVPTRWAKNQTELAGFFEVDRKTIARWRKQKDFPKPKTDGRWDIAAVREWRERTRDRGDSSEELSRSEGEARKVWLQVEKLEHELEVSRGKYIEISTVCGELRGLVTLARSQLLGIGDRLAPVVVGMTPAKAAKRMN